MEIKEAIDFINEKIQIDVSLLTNEEVSRTVEVLNMATAALEKQEGKKAKKEPRMVLDYCYYCPTCNKYFGGTYKGEWITGEPYYRCPECGQEIDWSE